MNLPDFLTEDRYGFVHFVGHRIGLQHVIDLHNEGYTPELLRDQLVIHRRDVGLRGPQDNDRFHRQQIGARRQHLEQFHESAAQLL